MTTPAILTTAEAATFLRLHRNTVLRRARELGGVKIGKDWRFRQVDLDALFKDKGKRHG